MQEREKILLGKKEKKRAPTARTVYVSLDRADAIIEGGAASTREDASGALPFRVWLMKGWGLSLVPFLISNF